MMNHAYIAHIECTIKQKRNISPQGSLVAVLQLMVVSYHLIQQMELPSCHGIVCVIFVNCFLWHFLPTLRPLYTRDVTDK